MALFLAATLFFSAEPEMRCFLRPEIYNGMALENWLQVWINVEVYLPDL